MKLKIIDSVEYYSMPHLVKITNIKKSILESYRNSNMISSIHPTPHKFYYPKSVIQELENIKGFENLRTLINSKTFIKHKLNFHNITSEDKLSLLKIVDIGYSYKLRESIPFMIKSETTLTNNLFDRFKQFCEISQYDEKYLRLKFGDDKAVVERDKMRENRSFSHSLDGYIEKYGELGIEKFNQKIEKTKNTKENFIKRHGHKEGERKYNNFKINSKHSEKKFIELYGIEEGKEKWQSFLNNIKNSKEKFIKNYGIDKGLEKYNKWCENIGQNEENLIRLYGEKLGREKYQKVVNKMKNINTKEYFIDKYGEEKGLKKWLERTNTKENFIKRYGINEGIKKWNKHINNIKKSKENFIRVHGLEEGTKRWDTFKKSVAKTKDNFIRVHGLEEGTKRWENYKNSNAGYRASKQSLAFFEPLTKHLINKGINSEDIWFGSNDSMEFKIETKDKLYSYDYTILSKKIIIEFNGNHVHPSKELLGEKWNDWKCAWSGESADEKHSQDMKKLKIAENEGFTVIEIWDFEDRNEALEKCLKLVEERI